MNEFPKRHPFHRQVEVDPDEGACPWEAGQQVGSNYHSYVKVVVAYIEDWVEKQVHHHCQEQEETLEEEDPKVGAVAAHFG